MRFILLKNPSNIFATRTKFFTLYHYFLFCSTLLHVVCKLLCRKFNPRCLWPLVRTKHLWTHINFQLGNLQEDKTFSLWLTSLPRLVFQLSAVYLVLIKIQIRIRYGRSMLARSGSSHKDSQTRLGILRWFFVVSTRKLAWPEHCCVPRNTLPFAINNSSSFPRNSAEVQKLYWKYWSLPQYCVY